LQYGLVKCLFRSTGNGGRSLIETYGGPRQPSISDWPYCKEQNVVKFKIPVIPRTTTKSIRFPNNLIEEIDLAIMGTDCTFTAFVVEAVRVALANLEESEYSSPHPKTS
jgi:hypothetical protein